MSPAMLLFFALTTVASANAEATTPLTKVVELLNDLKKQLYADGAKDAAIINEYKSWYLNETATAEAVITKTKETIESLQTTLNEEAAFRKKTQATFEETSVELSSNENDLKSATEVREKAHKNFQANEQAFLEAIDSLERSLIVLKKQAPGGGDEAAAPQPAAAALLSTPSLLAVAKKLRHTFQHSKDMHLTPWQQETLDGFIQYAAEHEQPQTATSFLQVRSRSSQPADYGEYQGQSSGVVDKLQEILDSTQKKRDEAMKQEEHEADSFKKFTDPLISEIEAGKKAMAELKVQMSTSEQTSAQKSSELAQNQELLKVTEEGLAQTEADHTVKMRDYQGYVDKHTDEIMAVEEAQRILTSESAKRFQKSQTIGTLDDATSFLQLSQTPKRAIRKLAQASKTPGVILLAMKTSVQLMSRAQAGEDPFKKVKGLIQQMLEKLMQEAAEEADHKAWCDTEMQKSEVSKSQKEREVTKLKNRLEAMEAELADLANGVAEANDAMTALTVSMNDAQKIRGKERTKNLLAEREYQDAQKLVKSAITVLQEFYGQEDILADGKDGPTHKSTSGGDDGMIAKDAIDPDSEDSKLTEKWGGKKTNIGMGSGVIGLLEIAMQDFADMEKETAALEAAAQKDFDDLMQEGRVKRATLVRELEFKSRRKTVLEGERQQLLGDLRGYEKELDAVNEYIDKLKPACTVQGDTYEERKARREAEIQSLKEALQILEGEAIA